MVGKKEPYKDESNESRGSFYTQLQLIENPGHGIQRKEGKTDIGSKPLGTPSNTEITNKRS